MLCDIHKSNQIESNSQRMQTVWTEEGSCVISTKVIKLKAIHNERSERVQAHHAV